MTSIGISARIPKTSNPNVAKSPYANLIRIAPSIWWHPYWRRKLKELLLAFLNSPKQRLSADEIEIRVRSFVIIIVTLILAFIVMALLYSVTFVSQPIKAMAPIDQAYTKMLNDIVLLIVGGIGGILTKGLTNEATNMMNAAKANTAAYVAPPPPPPAPVVMMAPSMSPTWTAPPPPAGPPVMPPPDERERMANARASLNA